MKISQVKKMTRRERFLYWIKEREAVRLRKEAGDPKPWTDDTILQENYFTNVRRRDDKVTRWHTENISEPLAFDHRVVFATIAFRWFNWIPTGVILLEPPFSEHKGNLLLNWNLKEALCRLGAQDRVFTGAFNISNSGSTKPKINRVCEDYIQPVWEQRDNLSKTIYNVSTMGAAFTVLQKLPGLGGSGFMAAQVICDLAYTSMLADAPDWYTWCSWGPGSKRGMNRLYGFDEDYKMRRGEWDLNLQSTMAWVNKEIDLGVYIHARDIQNCLCEFSKYERALAGGRTKRRYPGYA